MTLEQLVPILDLCQQLKDAGFPQDAAMYWQRSTMHIDHPVSVHVKGDNELGGIEDFFEDICAAPTAEEILKELPLFLNKAINEQLCVTREENTPACNGWLVGWWSMDIHGVLGGIGEKSLSNVAAKSYLWWKKEVAG